MNRHLNILISAAVLATGLGTVVIADPQRDRAPRQEREERPPPPPMHHPLPPTVERRQMPDRQFRELPVGRMVSMDRIMGHIQGLTPGRQLDAGLESLDGRSVYRVVWLTNEGRRVDYIVDPYTGQILSEH